MPLVIAAGAAVFAVHAACYLYFFVDDEAIPLVYARNLLRGHGLVYTPLEGRVEGYSDLLQVLLGAVVLGCLRVLHVADLAVLQTGKAASFAFGVGIVVLTGAMLARSRASLAGVTAGVAFIALAGPLAVWSCSSLEAVPFAFVITGLAAAMLIRPLRHRTALVLTALALLYRIDGFVYTGAVIMGALIAADAVERRRIFREIVLPAAGIAIAYHLARFAYFHSLLTAPMRAKVLYKLTPDAQVIVKAPAQTYLRRFIDLFGLAAIPAFGLAALGAARNRQGLGLVVAATLITAYAGLVGDWMFGWRFLIPALPLTAVAIGFAVAELRPPLAWTVAAVVLAWSAVGAQTVAAEFVSTQHKPIWWSAPRLGEQVWLAPYADLMSLARARVAPGETIAYNQAGLLPFVLDADNIDDLGICSGFEAGLPTTDVYFTEVGRYTPLTPAPVITAPHAYLLYRRVRTIMSRTDLLRNANEGRIPSRIIGGYYALAGVDASAENALYVRTDKPADVYRQDPTAFQEDLIHISRIRRADLGGGQVPAEHLASALPFLGWKVGRLTVNGSTHLALRFADADALVSTLYAAGVSATSPVDLTVTIFDGSGKAVVRQEAHVDPAQRALRVALPPGIRGRVFVLDARTTTAPRADLRIDNLRLMGQSVELGEYVRRMLPFPAR